MTVSDKRLEGLRAAYAYLVANPNNAAAPSIAHDRLESDRQHLSIIEELQRFRALEAATKEDAP